MDAQRPDKPPVRWYEILTAAVGMLLTVWFCVPFWFGVFGLGSYIGVLVGVLMMLYFPIKRFCKRRMARKAYFAVFSVVHLLVSVSGLWVAFLTVLMVFAVPQVPLANVTVVVLGGQVIGDRPSDALAARLDRAVVFLQENPEVNCVVTGGLGTNDRLPEARVMRNYLLERGIAPERLAAEERSRNTKENLANAQAVIRERGWGNHLAIVTEYYHQFRANRLADELGMRSYAVPAKTPWYVFSGSYARELLAITKFFLRV